LVKGFALGSVSHVAAVAALSAAGEAAMAESAAIGFFLLGVSRCIVIQIPGVPELLLSLSSSETAPVNNDAEALP
jgi:hypothetical protein